MKKKNSISRIVCLQKSTVFTSSLGVCGGLHGGIEWVSGEKDKRSALYSLLAEPCISPTIKQLHSGLLARTDQRRRRPNKNEAISWACRLWLTPNRAWMRSQDFFFFALKALLSVNRCCKQANNNGCIGRFLYFFTSQIIWPQAYCIHCPRFSVHNESHQTVVWVCRSASICFWL